MVCGVTSLGPWLAFVQPRKQPYVEESSVSDELTLESVFECEAPLIDVVFVHGLTGNPSDTWSTTDGNFWPIWLQDDLDNVSVYTLGYPASLFEKWANKEMDMFERARNILEQFAGIGIGERPLAFVAHSLGGILVKMVLRKSCEAGDEDCHQVSKATRLVIFLSTPHTGAAVANVLKLVPCTSSHIDLLTNKIGFLEDLNQSFRTLANDRQDLATAVYYEKYATKKIVVVTRESADPGISNVEPVPIDKDHVNICKPTDKDDTVYLGIKRHIQKVMKSVVQSTSDSENLTWVENYGERSTADRRDLFQKLIDADREHEYGYANDAQNCFARRYTKTGLLTAAREDHENLLSEIETRFVTHVYHPLICQLAPADDIRTALQEKVIDPLAGRDIGGTRFSAKSVLSGLFFLTEQCHIRWDPPE